MEKSTRQLFTPEILNQILTFYGFQPSNAQILDGFESFIYNITNNDQEYILRIGHDARRSPDLVRGEAEFLNHLAAGGLSVPQVLPSRNDRLIETVPAADGSNFVAALFTKAPGQPPARSDLGAISLPKDGSIHGQAPRAE